MELCVGNLIGWLETTVKWCVFLDSVVGEMDFSLEVENIELIGSSSDVAFLVPVSFEDSVELADHHIVANIELSLLVKERSVDVELDNEGLFCTVLMLSLTFHDGIEFIRLIDDCDSIASISQFSWFHDPNIPHWSSNSHAIFLILFLFADDGLTFLVISNESFILWILCALLDVEGQRNDLEEISTDQLVVFFEIVEESFLVAEVEVVGEMVVHLLMLVGLFVQL